MRVACLYFLDPCVLPNFAEACLRFTPQICLREPNALFLEIERSRRLFSEESFLVRMRRLLGRFQLRAKIAIASSVPHAYSMCRYDLQNCDELPLGALEHFLDPFARSEEQIRSASTMVESLKQLGLTKVEEFLALPASELSPRYGPTALLCRHRLRDEIDCPWPQWTPELRIVESREFQYEDFCADIQGLLQQLDLVIDRLFLRLWARSLSIAALKITMDFEKYSTTKNHRREFIFDFLLPQKTKRSIVPLIWERLSKEFTRKAIEAPIQKITLEVLQSSHDYIGQRNFFSSQEEVREQFNSAIAQLAESVGKENVFRAKIIETAVPEKSWERTFDEQKQLPEVAKYLPQRPTRLLRRPERVHVTRDTLHIRNRPYKIISWSSVEQISTGWIEAHVARNYYRIELANKPTVWIFKSPSEDYFLHGYFD